ncbi:MAG: hypothetical protein WA020_05745, partial [Candidatus Acidiferrales bacterium]
GQERAPLVTDLLRWRLVTFDSFGTIRAFATVYSMDDTAHPYGFVIDTAKKTVTLTKASDKNWKANFAYERTTPTELVLDGTMDNHKIHAQFEQVDVSKFLLLSRGFHWVQERGMNR